MSDHAFVRVVYGKRLAQCGSDRRNVDAARWSQEREANLNKRAHREVRRGCGHGEWLCGTMLERKMLS